MLSHIRSKLALAGAAAMLAVVGLAGLAAAQEDGPPWRSAARFDNGRDVQWRATPAAGCDGANIELRLVNGSAQSGATRLTDISLTCARGKPFSAPDQPLGVVSAGGVGVSAAVPCACADQGGVVDVNHIGLDFRLEGQGQETTADGCTYTGNFQNAMRNGMGKFTCPGGESYEGMFRNGRPNGEGTERTSTGAVFKGAFVDGQREGRGRMTFPDGSVYDGVFSKGRREGIGVMTYPDGSQYVGDWRADRRNGQGAYTGPKMAWTYDGEWINDERTGQGKMSYADGSFSYEGRFAKDVFEGVGATTFADGRVFRGEYRNGQQIGPGTLTFPNGRKIVGDFKDHVPNGKASDISATATFEGEWVDGKLNGHAVVIGNGARFEGEFKDGKRNGPGVDLLADGTRLECTYVDDQPQKPCKSNRRPKGPTIEYR